MTILYILVIYLLGSLLSYGRWNASIGEYLKHRLLIHRGNIFEYHPQDAAMLVSLSWISFIAGIVVYFDNKEREFLRFKNWS